MNLSACGEDGNLQLETDESVVVGGKIGFFLLSKYHNYFKQEHEESQDSVVNFSTPGEDMQLKLEMDRSELDSHADPLLGSGQETDESVAVEGKKVF